MEVWAVKRPGEPAEIHRVNGEPIERLLERLIARPGEGLKLYYTTTRTGEQAIYACASSYRGLGPCVVAIRVEPSGGGDGGVPIRV